MIDTTDTTVETTPHIPAPANSLKELTFDRNRGAILAFEFLWGLAMPLVLVPTVLPR